MKNKKDIKYRMNKMGKAGEPFVFIFDFSGNSPLLFTLENASDKILWEIPGNSNTVKPEQKPDLIKWKTYPVTFDAYKKAFAKVQEHIFNGDTYLLNLTQPTTIETNLGLEDIFHLSSASYKIYFKDSFVCFSPETFVKIVDEKIFSYPMKGTIDADLPNAKEIILNDLKEIAEHNTIVDLIRNDLSMIATNVKVDKFRYLEEIKTNQKNLLQVSSEISGDLPANYRDIIGDIILKMLPAGSISGAPKKKTLEIIKNAENYDRNYYTGIFGLFDGKNLDSCVLIRFIEKQDGKLVQKSGGGITFMSDAKTEYEEMLKKIYVPFA